MADIDWRHRCTRPDDTPLVIEGNSSWTGPWIKTDRTVTAPRTVEQSISLISAGVSALDGVAMTEDEKQRVWRLIEKAIEAVGETR
jgi:hypothetical protein